MSKTALTVAPTSAARYAYDNDQIALMKRTVAAGADDNAFLMFMELTSRYGLDPFAKQVYLAKMPGRDGEPPKYQTIVARDGLLAIANRNDDFRGLEGDVVYGDDIIERTPEGFVHTYAAVKAAERFEQPIVGAWARCYREGRVPTFFFAKLKSYKKNNKVWTNYPDAMNLKVAEAMVLRKAYSITGLIPEDEVGATLGPDGVGVIADDVQAVEQEPDWGPDEELAEKLKAIFAEANRVRPASFLPQKVRLRLAGSTQDERLAILREVTDYVLRHGGSVPIVGTVEEEPVDAEPVEDAA